MKAKLLKVFGFQGDAMNLPVADVALSIPYYVDKMGFDLVEQISDPKNKAVFERDGIRFAIVENGGDPEQDGCAFHTDDIEALRNEFLGNGLENVGDLGEENRDGSKFKVFFVVAPDGLCYWFGQLQ